MSEQQAQELNLSLTVEETNTVLAALGELPHRISDPLIRKLVQQAQPQLQQIQSEEEELTLPDSE